MENLTRLINDTDASGVYFLEGYPTSEELEELARSESLAFFLIPGEDVTDKDQFLGRCAEALYFPDYFGKNWDALDDCLTDMSWHEAGGYLILFRNCDAFAVESPEDFETALQVFNDSAEFWREQGKLFLVLVQGEAAETWDLASVSL